jgi:hypothetical protein
VYARSDPSKLGGPLQPVPSIVQASGFPPLVGGSPTETRHINFQMIDWRDHFESLGVEHHHC